MYGNYSTPQGVQPQGPQSMQHPVSASVFPRNATGPILPALTSQTGPSGSHAHSTASNLPVRTAEAAAAAKRSKKRKLPDRQIPEKVAHLVPESAIFNKLLEHERKIDDLLHKKKADISEALNKPEHIKKKLRVYVFNTHAHQKGPAVVSGKSDPPSWTLVVYGRIVDPQQKPVVPDGEIMPLPVPIPHSKHHPFTYYLRRLEVKLDPEQYPSNSIITWDRVKHVGEHKDQLEIRRAGNQPTSVEINIEIDWQPQRHQLPAKLAQVLGVQYETRPKILMLIYDYIRQHKLMDAKEPHLVRLDDTLMQVFGEETIKLTGISERLSSMLEPMAPIQIKYNVRLNGKSPTMPDCYDFDIQVPGQPHHDRMHSFLDKVGKDKDIDTINARISSAIQKLNEHRRRHTFFLGFSQSPVDFINALITSQARDLRIARNANGRDFEVEHRTQLFRGRWVEDAVMKYLHRRVASGH